MLTTHPVVLSFTPLPLGSLPLLMVLFFTPLSTPQCGLVKFKYPNVENFVDCKYMQMECGSPKLKKNHAYYWQVHVHAVVWLCCVGARGLPCATNIHWSRSAKSNLRKKLTISSSTHTCQDTCLWKMNSDQWWKKYSDPFPKYLM